MEVVNLKNVWLEDQAELGFEIAYLAKLKQAGIAVPDGVVVYPPKRLLSEIQKKYSEVEVFLANREKIKKEWLKTEVNQGFGEQCRKIHKISESEMRQLWEGILEKWFEQLSRSIVMKNEKVNWQGGYVLFCSPSNLDGWMEITGMGKVRVEAIGGELSSEDHTRLDLLAREINKLIPVAVKVWWRKGERLEVTRVSEIFFDEINGVQVMSVGEKVMKKLDEPEIIVTKVLLEDGAGPSQEAGGLVKDLAKVKSLDEEAAWLTHQIMLGTGDRVIYRLGRAGGALEWLQDMDRVDYELGFVKQLEQLSEEKIELLLPYCRSVVEYKTIREALRIKYGLAKMYWLEMGTPENLLNIEGYMEVGVRGVVVDLDRLSDLLQGLDSELSRVVVPVTDAVVSDVLGLGVKKLHRANCRVILAGEKVYDQEILDKAVGWGVWGVVTKSVNLDAIRKMLAIAETKVFKSLGARG